MPPHGSGRVQALLALSMPLALNTMDGELSAKLGSASHTAFKRDREPLILSTTVNLTLTPLTPNAWHSVEVLYWAHAAFLLGEREFALGETGPGLSNYFDCHKTEKARLRRKTKSNTRLLIHKNRIRGSMRLCRERY